MANKKDTNKKSVSIKAIGIELLLLVIGFVLWLLVGNGVIGICMMIAFCLSVFLAGILLWKKDKASKSFMKAVAVVGSLTSGFATGVILVPLSSISPFLIIISILMLLLIMVYWNRLFITSQKETDLKEPLGEAQSIANADYQERIASAKKSDTAEEIMGNETTGARDENKSSEEHIEQIRSDNTFDNEESMTDNIERIEIDNNGKDTFDLNNTIERANSGDISSIKALISYYSYDQNGEFRDPDKAFYWAEKGALKGDIDCMVQCSRSARLLSQTIELLDDDAQNLGEAVNLAIKAMHWADELKKRGYNANQLKGKAIEAYGIALYYYAVSIDDEKEKALRLNESIKALKAIYKYTNNHSVLLVLAYAIEKNGELVGFTDDNNQLEYQLLHECVDKYFDELSQRSPYLAAFYLGRMYLGNRGCRCDDNLSYYYLKKANDSGNEEGFDCSEMLSNYRKDSNGNYTLDDFVICTNCNAELPSGTFICPYCSTFLAEPNADFDKALEYMENMDSRAIEIFERLSESGYAPATYALGELYYNGDLGEENAEKALEYFTRLLDQGSPVAYGPIGSLYYIGKLGDENRYKAFAYLKKALEYYPDDVHNNFDIARCYANGIGTEKNIMEAKSHFIKILDAEPENEWYIISYADMLRDNGSAGCVEWYKKGSDLGSGICSYSLGRIYTEGMNPSVWHSYDNAVHYYQLAIEQLANTTDPIEHETYCLAKNDLNIIRKKHELGEI